MLTVGSHPCLPSAAFRWSLARTARYALFGVERVIRRSPTNLVGQTSSALVDTGFILLEELEEIVLQMCL
jgi:hypothetical protein